LTVYAFHPVFGFEAYAYCKDANNDGYTNPFKLHAAKKLQPPSLALRDANFVFYKVRRVPESNNVELLDSSNNTYRRCLFIRYVPGDGITTPATRAEGLRVLAAFLKDTTYSRYPPAEITTLDGTNVENPHSLDQFFMDNDIIDFIKTEFAESDLTSDFFERYPDLSRKLWAGQHYPEFARSLGFP
jgi:hypothetical protein